MWVFLSLHSETTDLPLAARARVKAVLFIHARLQEFVGGLFELSAKLTPLT